MSEGTNVEVRAARQADAADIALIFNQGIEERSATFETAAQRPERFAAAIDRGDLVLVAERGGETAGVAWIGPYADEHDYYHGVGEATLYVARDARRAGVGGALIESLAEMAPAHGYHKLVGKLFASNRASMAMLAGAGWRVVGTHLRHGKLDGNWLDVIVVERLLAP